MAKGTIAVVGRPNVGKSTFFNKLTGQRLSIVDDTPGVTRDRISAEAEWNGCVLTVIDTGGIEPDAGTPLLKQMRMQALVAIESADVIVFLADLHTGVTDADREIATMLRKSAKPVILAVNKVDTVGDLPPEFYDFYSLGFGDPVAVSSIHGTGCGDVLDLAVSLLPERDDEERGEGVIRVAVIGKPNAGKSSLVNRLTGQERVIVSDMPGTTRDAVDTPIENGYGKYVLIDTAGIRRGAKIEDSIEKYSVLRAKAAVERADVCLIMIDANEGVTAQDERIAGLAHNAGKASIIVINKWDSIEKDNDTVNKFRNKIYESLSYMKYAPCIFISALTGQRAERLFPMINEVYASASRRVTTGMLNDVLAEATARVQPPTDKGRRLKIYYMTQTGTNPPNFVVFVNNAGLFHFSYQRYLENCIRRTFGFDGTPINIVVRQRGENAENI